MRKGFPFRRLLTAAILLQPVLLAAAPDAPAESATEGYSMPVMLGFGFAAAGVVMFWARRYRRRRAARRDGERLR